MRRSAVQCNAAQPWKLTRLKRRVWNSWASLKTPSIWLVLLLLLLQIGFLSLFYYNSTTPKSSDLFVRVVNIPETSVSVQAASAHKVLVCDALMITSSYSSSSFSVQNVIRDSFFLSKWLVGRSVGRTDGRTDGRTLLQINATTDGHWPSVNVGV